MQTHKNQTLFTPFFVIYMKIGQNVKNNPVKAPFTGAPTGKFR